MVGENLMGTCQNNQIRIPCMYAMNDNTSSVSRGAVQGEGGEGDYEGTESAVKGKGGGGRIMVLEGNTFVCFSGKASLSLYLF